MYFVCAFVTYIKTLYYVMLCYVILLLILPMNEADAHY